MIPLTWWIAANTAVTALAVSLAALAFLRADRHMRHARNVVQACSRMIERHAEAEGERTQPHGEPPLLCGEFRPAAHETEPAGRHALADDTRHLPSVGDLHTGGEHR